MKFIITKYYINFIVKITFVHLLLSVVLITGYSEPVLGQESLKRTVYIDARESSVKDILATIAKQAHLKFSYSTRTIDARKKIDFQSLGTVESMLQQLFGDQVIVMELAGQLLLLKSPPAISEEKVLTRAAITVSGVVTDESGQPMPGVNVVEKRTANGTVTDVDGKYSLSVGDEAVLVFSFVGYVPKEIPVNSQSTINVSLDPDTKQIDEVVVVGYGTQKRNSMTNSVSQISGDDITKRPVSNIQQSFQGLMPGVTVLDQGGSPGKSNTNIRVRGITTFNINGSSTSGYDLGKNDALVVVDGIEQRFSDINPDDIESVSVLKDASSTAIYGSRATNGVILITTKRAKGAKVQVDYHGYYAIQKSNNVPKMMGLEAYMREQVAAYTNAGLPLPARFTEESIQAYVNATDREKYPLPNTWFETMLRTAPQQNHTISVAGGTDVIKTRLSTRFQDQQGVVEGYSNKIGEFRLNTDYTVSKRLRVSGDINYRYSTALNPTVNNTGANPTPMNNFFHGTLWAVPKYADGTYGLSTQGHNPLMYNEIGGQSKQNTDYLAGYLKVEVDIVEGLTFSTQIAGRGTFIYQKNFTNAYTNKDKNTNIIKTVAINSLTEVRNTLREYTINNLLTYEKSFGDHNLKALAGYSQIGNTQTFLSAYRERFYDNDIGSISQGANDGTKSNNGNDAEYGLRSFFGRVNYDYIGKYLFEANGRYDGSSKFTGSKQYSFFPSFSAGWRISKESFWAGLEKAVNDLKIRGSWGITGNQSVDIYSYYAALTAGGYTFGGTSVQGYRPTTLANTNLGWESTTQMDLGIDAAFLNKRFTLTVDYYRKLTDDILLNLDIPATIGLTAPPQNAGSVENKGWEFSLNYRGAATASGFRYSLGANLSINENKVVDLKGTGPYITGSDIDPRYIIAKGLPINTQWGYQTDGLFQSEQEIAEYKATYVAKTKPGDVKYVDRNKDGKINADDMMAIGNSFPKYTFGLNSDFSYKNFELSILFQGAAKVDARLAGALAEMGNQEGFVHEIYTNNYWTPEHTDARFPRPVKFDLRNVATSDRLVIDGSYLRLKNVQLAYTIPAAMVNKLRLSRMKVYTSVTNLLTFSKLNKWNLDPEVSSGRAVYFPQTALYTFGLNLQF